MQHSFSLLQFTVHGINSLSTTIPWLFLAHPLYPVLANQRYGVTKRDRKVWKVCLSTWLHFLYRHNYKNYHELFIVFFLFPCCLGICSSSSIYCLFDYFWTNHSNEYYYFLLLLILPVTVNTNLHLWLLLPTTTMIHLKSWNPSWISKCSCLYGISWNGVTIAKGICHGNSWWDIHQCRSTWIGKFKSSGTIFQLTSEPTDSWAACFTTNRVSDWIGLDMQHVPLGDRQQKTSTLVFLVCCECVCMYILYFLLFLNVTISFVTGSVH